MIMPRNLPFDDSIVDAPFAGARFHALFDEEVAYRGLLLLILAEKSLYLCVGSKNEQSSHFVLHRAFAKHLDFVKNRCQQRIPIQEPPKLAEREMKQRILKDLQSLVPSFQPSPNLCH